MGERSQGKVWLVGAGPGDPELLTVRAARLLESATFLAHDELVPEAILAIAKHAERYPVGRRANGVRYHDDVIHPEVLKRAREGTDVIRLKSGDPMIFGRGGEEALALAQAGIDVEIVPGITAALGAAATNFLPLTHRELSAAVTFATAHVSKEDDQWARKLALSLPTQGTLVLYMGAGSIEPVSLALIERGFSKSVPVQVVSRATWPTEATLVSTLADVAKALERQPVELPALFVIGDVVKIASQINQLLT